MATRADFTVDEWTEIMQSPLLAAMVVMATPKSGPIQMAQEMVAAVAAMADAATKDQGNGIIGAIGAAMQAKETPKPIEMKPETVEAMQSLALGELQRVVAIVDAKGGTDASGYKTWLVSVAHKVAEAAKEGAFLGFGGAQVTADETAAIGKLAAALGVSA